MNTGINQFSWRAKPQPDPNARFFTTDFTDPIRIKPIQGLVDPCPSVISVVKYSGALNTQGTKTNNSSLPLLPSVKFWGGWIELLNLARAYKIQFRPLITRMNADTDQFPVDTQSPCSSLRQNVSWARALPISVISVIRGG